ncbi:MAG: hypothetical protein IKU26_07780 [Clostridia bacterium]|nr:hypothetical protein [Clostridia bacterium]
MSASIATVTLNPALDIHYTLNAFVLGKENYPEDRKKLAAGKGVNISRVLKRHDINAPAYLLLGTDNGAEYLRLLESYGVPCGYMAVPGSVRENLSVNCPEQHQETRLCMKGFTVTPEDGLALIRLVMDQVPAGAYVALCGSLPPGITGSDFVGYCIMLRDAGYRVIVDCPSLSIADLQEIQPWLIKPNEKEAMALLGLSGKMDGEAIAKKLTEIFPQVIVSLGPDGLVYANKEQTIRKSALPTEIYTTVGAGDSLVAGFLYGTVTAPENVSEALDYGLSFAAETCRGI